MKRALDYVSDYQLESACKDAPCIAQSRVTEKIFALLVDWYHHIFYTQSFKLVSLFYIYYSKEPHVRLTIIVCDHFNAKREMHDEWTSYL